VTITRAGIIAAGEGSRLRALHPGLPKPLIPVGGAPLCHWVARSFQEAGLTDLTLLHNSRGRAIPGSLRGAFPAARWTFLERDTASSWESFRLVAKTLDGGGPFLMSTADALVAPKDLAAFLREAQDYDAALALTSFIDDEKPLYADLKDGQVTALGPDCKTKALATSGLYVLGPNALAGLPEPGKYSSLREFWLDLVRGGAKIKGIVLNKTLDVDRPEDLSAAEQFVKETAWCAPR
jgi:NDP-sugar pyrophosphorylase family protein